MSGECVFNEKILAVTHELARKYKHLVDAYSLSQISKNIEVLQGYLKIILDFNNITRAKFSLKIGEYKYQIVPEKRFTNSYFVPMFQSVYNMNLDKMIEKFNKYKYSSCLMNI